MKMYIARRKTKSLNLFINNKPELVDKRWGVWIEKDGFDYLDYGIRIDSGLFPEVTFENSPQEVELKLIEK